MNQPTLVPTVDLAAQPNTPSRAIAKAMSKGDLRALTEVERLHYNLALCRSLGLNPLTRPFDYLVDERSGRVSLYLNSVGVTQLRELRGISTRVVSRHTDEEGLHYVTCLAEDLVGRKEEATAIVSLCDRSGRKLQGQAKANVMMRAETKSKRRATLSLCGLGGMEAWAGQFLKLNDVPLDLLPA